MFIYQTKLKDGNEALIIKNNPQIPAVNEQVVAVYGEGSENMTATIGLFKDGEILPSNQNEE